VVYFSYEEEGAFASGFDYKEDKLILEISSFSSTITPMSPPIEITCPSFYKIFAMYPSS
jgi:hypothetical protein